MQNDKSKFKKDFIQRLIKYSLKIIKLCGKLRKDRNLCPITDQLMRSATSVGANVVEAKSSSSRKNYIHYFEIALKSANEAKFWLILVRESSNENRNEAQDLLDETEEISNIIGSSILTLKGKR